ncbi:MAG: phosphatase PAP2 family protein [Chitinophagaceae bacterium]
MKYVFASILLIQLQAASCQVAADSIPVTTAGEYFKSYWTNGIRFVSQPARWKGKDWAIFGGSVAITAGLTRIDEDINKPFARWNAKGTGFGKAGDFIGSTPVALGSTLVTLGIASIVKNHRLQNFALDNLQAQVFTGAFTFAVKNLFGRARPSNGLGANYWDGPFKSNKFESFFSGHTSVAFSTATMIFLHSNKKPWVGLLSYGVATGIGISRMQYQMHWASDVLMGAVCGWAVSSFIYHQNEKNRMAPKARPVM